MSSSRRQTARSGGGSSLHRGHRPVAARQTADPSRNRPAGPSFNASYRTGRQRVSFDSTGLHIPRQDANASELLITRRQLLYGAAGLAVLIGAGTAGTVISKQVSAGKQVSALSVSTDSVSTLEDCTEVSADDAVREIGEYDMPFGTLVWASNDSVAACLLPTSGVKPLTQVALLSLSSGNSSTVLGSALNQGDGFEIYDVRASESGIIWTEANILEGTWRLYVAATGSSNSAIGTPHLVDQGDSAWETPTIAAVGSYAFWQVMPEATGSASKANSAVKRTSIINGGDADLVYTSTGHFATPITSTGTGVVIAPRVSSSSIYYRLTLLDGQSGQTTDSLTLPASIAPSDAGYGADGFTFTLSSIYDASNGVGNLGTYTAAQTHDEGDYGNLPWFRFDKTPTMAPAWCGSHLIVKSTSAVVGVDPAAKTYFALSVDNAALDYGDCLASTGNTDSFVTFMNIDSTQTTAITAAEVQGSTSTSTTATTKKCLVRVWQPRS